MLSKYIKSLNSVVNSSDSAPYANFVHVCFMHNVSSVISNSIMFDDFMNYILVFYAFRYLIQKQGSQSILFAEELEAFLAQALSPQLTTECNVTNLSQIKVSKLDVRGVTLATIFMRGVEAAIFANDACGSPIPWDLVCPWNYFDGKLFQSKLNVATSETATLLDLCDGNVSAGKYLLPDFLLSSKTRFFLEKNALVLSSLVSHANPHLSKIQG